MCNEKKVRAAIYCRLAREDEGGMEIQLYEMRGYAAQSGYADCAEYVDNGASGLTLDRPGFLRMMEDIRAGSVHTVLVRDVSRISRGFLDFYSWLGEMRELGTGVISKYGGIVLDGNYIV